jgi:hypothetical protein
VGLNNTDDYLNSFITIQDIPMAVSTLDGNVYESKPLFFFRKDGDTYEILEVYNDLDIYNKIKETFLDSKDSEGCININPYFELGTLDYENYTNDPTKGEIIQDDVYKYTNALSIKKNGTLIGTKKIPIVPGRDYRASIAMKAYTDYNKSVNPNEQVSIYVGVCCYDGDDKVIRPYNLPIVDAPW